MNNIELIKPFLLFNSDDDFYHLQIIKRKKEHPELGSNNYIVKTYYIRSIEYLELRMPEIINLCDFHNARAGINLNVRSFEKLAYQSLKKVTDCILNKDFKSIRKAYESVCGKFSNAENNKVWIIDIDVLGVTPEVFNIFNYLHQLNPNPYLATIPTKNGKHVLTRSFRLDKFKEVFPGIDVHKDNPTLLYFKE